MGSTTAAVAGRGDEGDVEQHVVEGEDPAAEGVVDPGLHEGVDADLDALGGQAEEEDRHEQGGTGVEGPAGNTWVTAASTRRVSTHVRDEVRSIAAGVTRAAERKPSPPTRVATERSANAASASAGVWKWLR